MNFGRAILTIGGFTGISRISGMVREVLMSHFMGAGMFTDVFVVALRFPSLFRRIFAEGAFNAAFVPTFAGVLAEKDDAHAKSVANDIFTVMGTFMVFFVAAVIFLMPWLMYVISPGFAKIPEKFQMAIQFTQITFPYIMCMALGAVCSGILNATNRFGIAAAAPILLNVVMVAALVGLGQMDILNTAEGARMLSIAALVAGIAQVAAVYIGCLRAGYFLRPQWPCMSPEVKKILILMAPGMVGAGVFQLNVVVDGILASYLPQGSVTYLNYADRLNQLPLSMIGVAIGTALLPVLSRQIRTGQQAEAIASQNGAVRASLQLSVPAACGLIMLSDPLIRLLYQHGAFTEADVMATAPTLAAFAVGLPGYVLSKVFMSTFFARSDTKTPVVVGAVCVAINLGLNLLLIGPFKQVGLALSTAIAAWINAYILYAILVRRGEFQLTQSWGSMYLPLIAASGLMMVCLLGLQRVMPYSTYGATTLGEIFTTLVYVGAGVLAYTVFARVFGVFRFTELRTLLKAS